jgi:SAM-dependent methyltransferase
LKITTNRNFKNYWDKYKEIYSFEQFSSIYREIECLKSITFKKKQVLELGCGYRPLFPSSNEYNNYFAIEPGQDPFKEVLKTSKKFKNVHVINSTFEDWCFKNPKVKVDLIILPGVLHEVDNANEVLNLCLNHLNQDGTIYINVPNANSLHRRIAVSMGVLKDTTGKSHRNLELEQNYNFSTESLKNLLNKVSTDLEIKKLKTFFLKPFTHEQMLSMFTKGIIDHKIIKGLYEVSDQTEELGSEIACVVKYKSANL